MTQTIFKPRYILAVYLALCFVFALAAGLSSGSASIAMLILVLCAESACFATIFTLALRGLGRHTKLGGSCLVAAISGGAVFPPMTGAVATHLQNIGSKRPFHLAMLIPMAGYVAAWIYPLYVNVWNKETMDVRRDTNLNVVAVGPSDKEMALEGMGTGEHVETSKTADGIETEKRE